MAQVLTIRGRDASTFVGEEATFGTTPTMTRAFPITGDAGAVAVDGLTQEQLPVENESVYINDVQTDVHGYQGGTAPMELYFAPNASQLTNATAVAEDDLGALLRCSLGAESPPVLQAEGGSTVAAAGSSTTSIVVAAGDGANFAVGQWIAPECTGALEPCYITAISTDTLSVKPTLSAIPTSTTGLVIGGRTYAYDQAQHRKMTWQHAKASNSAQQWTMNGVLVTPEFMLENGKLPKFKFTGNIARWIGPSAQSIAVTAGTNPAAACISMRSPTVLFQPVSTLTRTSQYALESFSVKLGVSREFAMGMGGDIEGKLEAVTTGDHELAIITLGLSGTDTVMDSSNWTSQTDMQLIIFAASGSLLTKRFVGVHVPCCFIRGKPKTVARGKRIAMELTLVAKLDTVPTATTAMAKAAIRFFRI